MKDDKLEPSSNRKAAKYRGAECLNCGHPLDLSDVYCSYCSQLNSTKQLSLKDFFGEFINSIISYDSRLSYTVMDLLFKPGKITRNYVNGQRLKYANPFRFFLSVSIIYFLIQGLISTFSENGSPFINMNQNTNPSPTDSVSKTTNNSFQFNKSDFGDKVNIANEAIIINNDTVLKSKEKTAEDIKYISEADLDTLGWGNRIVTRFSLYRDFYEVYNIKSPTAALDSLKHNNTAFNRWIYGKNKVADRIQENPYSFFNYLLSKTPFFLFFFTPFFSFFFWILYSRKKYSYIEHIVFIFHIFSFIFLGLLICLIPDSFLNNAVFSGILFSLIGPFYFYKALRNFYKQSRLLTIIKFVFLNIVFGISATMAAALFFSISTAIY
jgi:hypothetical protein